MMDRIIILTLSSGWLLVRRGRRVTWERAA